MTEVRTTTPPEFPWERSAEYEQPSALYRATDRLTATIFLRPTTPIEMFDYPHSAADYRVNGLRVGDLTIQFPAGDGDAGVVATCSLLIDAITKLSDSANNRLVPAVPA